VNLHGGDGYYTPIAVGSNLSTELRPLYYGMKFASHLSGSEMYDCQIDKNSNLTAYFGRKGAHSILVLVNKGQNEMTLDLPQRFVSKSQQLRFVYKDRRSTPSPGQNWLSVMCASKPVQQSPRTAQLLSNGNATTNTHTRRSPAARIGHR
jgi:hypothetical protein